MADAPKPKRTGTVFKYAPPKPGERFGHYVVRCSAPDGTRPLFHLDQGAESPEAEAVARQTAEDITAELWARGLVAAPKPGSKAGKQPAGTGDGCSAWFALWIAERKRRGYTSTPENSSHYHEHIEPAIGPKHIRDWNADDLRTLSRVLDVKVQGLELSWKSASNVWGTATKMCKDACSSKTDALRVRADNPAIGVAAPDRGPKTAKQYLYPSEFQRFIACDRVPLEWRQAVALAIYIFPRAGELRVLRWEDVDLAHGTVHIHRARDRNTGEEKQTKTAMARRFSIEPALLPLLRAMHGDGPAKTGFVAELPSERDMARGFRRWLAKAGVDRAELHAGSRTRKAMTFHDLRATGLTWLAVRGDDSLKIMQRAGHTDFVTTQGYIREAEAVREGFGDVFPALPESLLRPPEGDGPRGGEIRLKSPLAAVTVALPQLLSQGTQVHEIIAGRTGLEPGSGCTPEHELSSIGDRDCQKWQDENDEPRRKPARGVPERGASGVAAKLWEQALDAGLRATATEIADSLAEGNGDAVEAALADAVTRATTAGQWDVVQALVSELQARRRARAGVAELDAERARRGKR